MEWWRMTWVHGEEEIMSHKPFVFSNASLLYTSITHEAHNQKPSEAGRALQTCTGASEELNPTSKNAAGWGVRPESPHFSADAALKLRKVKERRLFNFRLFPIISAFSKKNLRRHTETSVHSSIFACSIPWTEELGRLWSMELQRVYKTAQITLSHFSKEQSCINIQIFDFLCLFFFLRWKRNTRRLYKSLRSDLCQRMNLVLRKVNIFFASIYNWRKM